VGEVDERCGDDPEDHRDRHAQTDGEGGECRDRHLGGVLGGRLCCRLVVDGVGFDDVLARVEHLHSPGAVSSRSSALSCRAHHHRTLGPLQTGRCPLPAESSAGAASPVPVGLGLAGGPSIRLVVVERLDAGRKPFPATGVYMMRPMRR